MIYEYKGKLYPDYLKTGNACQFIAPAALKFCQGNGIDVGASIWPLGDSIPIDVKTGGDALNLPEGQYDYVFSSHCLEHLEDPVKAILHWKTRIKKGGVLFLYLPHPDMEYWLPENCAKHLHSFTPHQIVNLLTLIGFKNILHSERDLAWGFAVVGFNDV